MSGLPPRTPRGWPAAGRPASAPDPRVPLLRGSAGLHPDPQLFLWLHSVWLFVLTILAGLAQMEREQIAERTRDAMAELRRQGRRISGKPPFGYRFKNGRVVPVPREQRVLRKILKLRTEGLGSWRIWKWLNARGGKNPRTGRAWSRGSVVAILKTAEKPTP